MFQGDEKIIIKNEEREQLCQTLKYSNNKMQHYQISIKYNCQKIKPDNNLPGDEVEFYEKTQQSIDVQDFKQSKFDHLHLINLHSERHANISIVEENFKIENDKYLQYNSGEINYSLVQFQKIIPLYSISSRNFTPYCEKQYAYTNLNQQQQLPISQNENVLDDLSPDYQQIEADDTDKSFGCKIQRFVEDDQEQSKSSISDYSSSNQSDHPQMLISLLEFQFSENVQILKRIGLTNIQIAKRFALLRKQKYAQYNLKNDQLYYALYLRRHPINLQILTQCTWKNLVAMYLGYSNIHDSGWNTLVKNCHQFQSLQVLGLSMNFITTITDQDFQILTKNTQINRLYIYGNRLTPQSVQCFKQFYHQLNDRFKRFNYIQFEISNQIINFTRLKDNLCLILNFIVKGILHKSLLLTLQELKSQLKILVHRKQIETIDLQNNIQMFKNSLFLKYNSKQQYLSKEQQGSTQHRKDQIIANYFGIQNEKDEIIFSKSQYRKQKKISFQLINQPKQLLEIRINKFQVQIRSKITIYKKIYQNKQILQDFEKSRVYLKQIIQQLMKLIQNQLQRLNIQNTNDKKLVNQQFHINHQINVEVFKIFFSQKVDQIKQLKNKNKQFLQQCILFSLQQTNQSYKNGFNINQRIMKDYTIFYDFVIPKILFPHFYNQIRFKFCKKDKIKYWTLENNDQSYLDLIQDFRDL